LGWHTSTACQNQQDGYQERGYSSIFYHDVGSLRILNALLPIKYAGLRKVLQPPGSNSVLTTNRFYVKFDKAVYHQTGFFYFLDDKAIYLLLKKNLTAHETTNPHC
jgi:hypothetical protein